MHAFRINTNTNAWLHLDSFVILPRIKAYPEQLNEVYLPVIRQRVDHKDRHLSHPSQHLQDLYQSFSYRLSWSLESPKNSQRSLKSGKLINVVIQNLGQTKMAPEANDRRGRFYVQESSIYLRMKENFIKFCLIVAKAQM